MIVTPQSPILRRVGFMKLMFQPGNKFTSKMCISGESCIMFRIVRHDSRQFRIRIAFGRKCTKIIHILGYIHDNDVLLPIVTTETGVLNFGHEFRGVDSFTPL
jgi:hypothetical protein